MEILKKAAAAAISALLALSVAGCNKAVTNTGGDGEVSIKFFSDLKTTMAGDLAWIEYVERETGIKLLFESPPATSYKERLQVMLASGDYPDVVLFKSANDVEFVDAVKSGIVIPVNEYIKGKENLEKFTYDYSWDAMKAMQDDKIYGIPRSTLRRTDGFFVRADWLKNVGLEAPADRTIDLNGFYEILKRFTYNDPNQNGRADTYGICSYSHPTYGLMLAVEETFGLFGWQKAENDDYEYMDPKYSRKNDTYKKALEFNARLFKEKLIDPDAPVINTYVNSTERFKRGITGVLRAFPGFLDGYIKDLKKITPEADIAMITGIRDSEGNTKVGTEYSSGYYNLWALTISNKHPEKTIEFLDWLMSDDEWQTTMYGLEGSSYNIVDGKKVFVTEPDMGYALGRNFVRRNTDVDFYITNTTDEARIPLIKEALAECIAVSVPSLDRDFKPTVSSKPEFMDYQKNMVQTVTKILLGEVPVSEYDKVLDGWYKVGGEEYVREMNDYLKRIEAE